jgi:hypothetical protein
MFAINFDLAKFKNLQLYNRALILRSIFIYEILAVSSAKLGHTFIYFDDIFVKKLWCMTK